MLHSSPNDKHKPIYSDLLEERTPALLGSFLLRSLSIDDSSNSFFENLLKTGLSQSTAFQIFDRSQFFCKLVALRKCDRNKLLLSKKSESILIVPQISFGANQ